jgi:hypothetical protein
MQVLGFGGVSRAAWTVHKFAKVRQPLPLRWGQLSQLDGVGPGPHLAAKLAIPTSLRGSTFFMNPLTTVLEPQHRQSTAYTCMAS